MTKFVLPMILPPALRVSLSDSSAMDVQRRCSIVPLQYVAA